MESQIPENKVEEKDPIIPPANEPPKEEEKKPEGTENTSGNENEPAEEEFVTREVVKMHGIPVEELGIEYVNEAGEEIDPDSAEGIYKLNLAIAQYATQEARKQWEKENPDAHRLELFLKAGNKLEDFDRTISLPEPESIKDNLSEQKKWFYKAYGEKGLEDSVIDLIYNKALTDKTVETYVTKYLEDKQKSLNDSKISYQAELDKIAATSEEQTEILNDLLQEVYTTNNPDITRIPDAKIKESFTNFTSKLEQRRDGTYVYVIPISNDNLKRLTQVDYIMHNPDVFKKSAEPSAVEKKVRTVRDNIKKVEESTVSTASTVDPIRKYIQ